MEINDKKIKLHVRRQHSLTLSNASQWALRPGVDGLREADIVNFSSLSGNWEMFRTFQSSVN